MKTTYLLGALALTMSSVAFAHETATTPEHECCCCKEGEHGEMDCCAEEGAQPESDHTDHAGHSEGGAN